MGDRVVWPLVKDGIGTRGICSQCHTGSGVTGMLGIRCQNQLLLGKLLGKLLGMQAHYLLVLVGVRLALQPSLLIIQDPAICCVSLLPSVVPVHAPLLKHRLTH